MITSNLLTYGERKNFPERERSSFITNLVGTLVGGAVIIAIGISPIISDYLITKRDLKEIEKNKCVWNESIATRADEEEQYTGIARRIIENPNVDLGKTVGITRMRKYIAEANENKRLRKGQIYNSLYCGCNSIGMN